MKITQEQKDRAKLTTLLKAYCNNYGFDQYIRQLISSHSSIRGGWSFNNSKGDLAHQIETHVNG